MDIIWHHRNTRHWTQEGEDWLCLRINVADSVTSVILSEDSHHYFKEVHIHTEDSSLESHRLDGPGPFEIPLDRVGTCILIARVFFFRYFRAPCPAGEVHPDCCGEVFRSGGSDPQRLMMQIGHETTTTRGAQTGTSLTIDEVLRKVIRVQGQQLPELVRSGDDGAVPFMLQDEARIDTCVFVFKQIAPVPPFSSGQLITLSDWSKPNVDRCEIPVGRWNAIGAKPHPDWSIAVPVSKRDDGKGIAGVPFIIKPLISQLKVIPQPPGGVYAEWLWHGPSPWIKVRLRWEFYDDQGYANSAPQMMIVSKAEYDRRGTVEFLHYARTEGLRYWCVLVTATPILFGNDVITFPELETTARL